ncbi:MAG: 4Fe-4S binding protein [Bacillota bacterium]|jgi:carbon-monoxide dehydrogenase iron sulfur subunit
MKRLVANADLCIGCLKCEETCSTAYRKKNLAELSAIRVTVNEVEPHILSVCNQCGECIAICPTQAISRDKTGVVRIKKADCVGCLSCVGFCPSLSMRYHSSLVEPFKCIACGLCAKECPSGALAIVNQE